MANHSQRPTRPMGTRATPARAKSAPRDHLAGRRVPPNFLQSLALIALLTAYGLFLILGTWCIPHSSGRRLRSGNTPFSRGLRDANLLDVDQPANPLLPRLRDRGAGQTGAARGKEGAASSGRHCSWLLHPACDHGLPVGHSGNARGHGDPRTRRPPARVRVVRSNLPGAFLSSGGVRLAHGTRYRRHRRSSGVEPPSNLFPGDCSPPFRIFLRALSLGFY